MNMPTQINVGFQLSDANNNDSETAIARHLEAPSIILKSPAVAIGICEE